MIKGKKIPLDAPNCSDKLIWDIWLSSNHLPALTVADELGLFSFLEKEPASSLSIARKFFLSFRGTEALLGILTSLGFLVQQNGKFCLTLDSRNFLLPNSPYYKGGLLKMIRYDMPTHEGVKEALLNDPFSTTTSITKDKPNTDNWKKGDFGSEWAKKTTEVMHDSSFPGAMSLANQGVFNNVKKLLDVGGGSGCFSIAAANFNAGIRCSILEWPQVCAEAEKYVQEFGFEDRIDTYGADMFKEPWPQGYDGILFANVFHDWMQPESLELGRKAFENLASNGRIFIYEQLLNDTKDGPLAVSAFTMLMMRAAQGKMFSSQEMEDILTECGFVDISITPVYTYYSLIQARKP